MLTTISRIAGITVVLLSSNVQILQAQVVEDTLDWKRYFPLQIGNEWQYRDGESAPISRFRIFSDTTANGQHYFIAEEEVIEPLIYDGTQFHVDFVVEYRVVYLRYDASRVVAEFDHPTTDSGIPPPGFRRGGNTFLSIDLGLGFGFESDSIASEFGLNVSGGYQDTLRVVGDPLPVSASKTYTKGAIYWSYAADWGFLGGGNLWGPRLVYARVGDKEIGAKVVSVQEQPKESGIDRSVLDVYPNPANKYVQIKYAARYPESATISLFDVSGRNIEAKRISVLQNGIESIFKLDVSNLSSGEYFVVAVDYGGTSISSSLTILH